MFLAKSQKVLVELIDIPADRQRKEISEDHIKALAGSIERRKGLIHPILVKPKPEEGRYELIAGECRLRAHMHLGWEDISVRFNNTQDPHELKILELEENIKRSDLTWQEKVNATAKLHAAFTALDPEWSTAKTADVIGIDHRTVQRDLELVREHARGNTKVMAAEKISQAQTVLKRGKAREFENMSNLLFKKKPAEGEVLEKPPAKVIVADFIEWSSAPRTEPFSVIHCDFPYGVGMHKSGQVSESLGNYEDTPEIYFNLLNAFVANYKNFATPVSHIMFWFSMNFYDETRAALANIPNSRVFPFPLIWHKEDGKGIIPNALQEPRRTYETALLVSVGGRVLVKPSNNSCSHPTDQTRDHVSRKPPAVLQHFLSMLVEPGVRVLDPTCGSGSALVVAQNLGGDVFGMDVNEEYVKGIKL